MKFRKCYVLREAEINMSELKKGDVFRLGKAADTDCVNPEEWQLAGADAKPCEPEGNAGVECSPLAFVKQPSKNELRFR